MTTRKEFNNSKSPVPVPKVAAAGITMGVLVVIVAMLAAITPDMLQPLGQWGPVVFAGITAVGGFLAGYIKRS